MPKLITAKLIIIINTIVDCIPFEPLWYNSYASAGLDVNVRRLCNWIFAQPKIVIV